MIRTSVYLPHSYHDQLRCITLFPVFTATAGVYVNKIPAYIWVEPALTEFRRLFHHQGTRYEDNLDVSDALVGKYTPKSRSGIL